eukprot:15290736-Ditylum_brightwellii.AAC.1
MEQTPFVRYSPIAAKALEIIEDEPAAVEEKTLDEPAPMVEKTPRSEKKSIAEESPPIDTEEEEVLAVEEEEEVPAVEEEEEVPAVEGEEKIPADKGEEKIPADEEETSTKDTSLGSEEEELKIVVATSSEEDKYKSDLSVDNLKPFDKVQEIFPNSLSNMEF